jgi:hypothetical protein
MFEVITGNDLRITSADALDYYNGFSWGKPVYTQTDRNLSFFYRCDSWDSRSNTAILDVSYPERMHIVRTEAYERNERTAFLTSAPLPLSMVSDTENAERQAVALNASAVQREKLRELVTARRDAELEVTRLKELLGSTTVALNVARDDITDPSDSRLTHVWVLAARSASKSGHCGEYDQLASDIGALNRDELRSKGYSVSDRASLTVQVTVIVNIEVEDYDDWQSGDWEDVAYEAALEESQGDAEFHVISSDRVSAEDDY